FARARDRGVRRGLRSRWAAGGDRVGWVSRGRDDRRRVPVGRDRRRGRDRVAPRRIANAHRLGRGSGPCRMIKDRARTSRAKPVGLPVLTYHAFGTRRSVTATDPSWFAETLAALVESGNGCVDLANWVAQGRPDNPRAFALAFDDGLRSL